MNSEFVGNSIPISAIVKKQQFMFKVVLNHLPMHFCQVKKITEFGSFEEFAFFMALPVLKMICYKKMLLRSLSIFI